MKQDRTRAPWAVTLATLKGFNMLLISYTVQQALYLHVQVHERSCLPLLDNDTLGCILLRNSNVISLAKQGVTLISPESTSKTPVGCSIRFFLIHCTTFFPQSWCTRSSFFFTPIPLWSPFGEFTTPSRATHTEWHTMCLKNYCKHIMYVWKCVINKHNHKQFLL